MANDYEVKNLNNLGQLKKLATRAKAEIAKAAADATAAIKSGTYTNNTLSFFTSKDGTGTPVFTANLPEEMFLDQNKTAFVEKFHWSDEAYPGSTNPNLENKPVMVLAVKGDDGDTYSFLNVEKLMNIYTPKAGDGSATVAIDGFEISANVNLSDDSDNIITKDANGKLLAKHQDISGKANKLAEDSTKTGNILVRTADGDLADGGKTVGALADKPATATENNLAAFDGNKNPVDSGIPKADVQQKLASGAFTENNFRMTDANGFAKDAGFGLATDAEVDAMLDEVFGPAV